MSPDEEKQIVREVYKRRSDAANRAAVAPKARPVRKRKRKAKVNA